MERHPPELILRDINMPRCDGLELCRTLRNDPIRPSARLNTLYDLLRKGGVDARA